MYQDLTVKSYPSMISSIILEFEGACLHSSFQMARM